MDAPPNIVLTGFMGTGKTTIGRLLARRLGMGFVDTDQLIERRHGPIPELFASGGESAFRALEREVAAELAERHGVVIATGGRLMLNPENARLLTASGRVFCLVAGVDEILARVGGEGSPERPLLVGADMAERVAELLAERQAGYALFEQVPTEHRTPAEIVDDIIDRWSGPTADV